MGNFAPLGFESLLLQESVFQAAGYFPLQAGNAELRYFTAFFVKDAAM